MGKRALFSNQDAAKGPLTVHCVACDRETSLSVVEFLAQHLPFWLWLPWRRHSHLMRCPACGKLAWHSVS